MARGRMISKEISLDEKVDALSDDTARLLFTWMIPHLDVEGRMYGDPQIFKSIVAPRRHYSIKKIEKYLTEMENIGLIERYIVNGNRYIFSPQFEKHQMGLRKDREAQSKIPSKTPDLGRTNDGLTQLQVKEKFKFKRKEDKDNNIKQDVFKLYEDNIGQLTTMITEELKDAEKTYSAEWVAAAIKEAVVRGKRNLKYILAILENWQKGGKDSTDFSKGTARPDPSKFFKGKYGHMVWR